MRRKILFATGLLFLSFIFIPYIWAQENRIFLLDQGLSLVEQKKVVILKKGINKVTFSPLPEGIIPESIYPELGECEFLEQSFLSPSALTWKVSSKIEGQTELKITYLTKGINWKINYQIEIDEQEKYFNLFAWLSVENKSGVNWSSVSLGFIEARAFQYSPQKREGPSFWEEKSEKSDNPAVEFQSNITVEVKKEDVIYYLNAPVDLEKDRVKTFLIFSILNIPTYKVFLFDGEKYGNEVREELFFKNFLDENLNLFFPQGKLYIYKDISGGEKLYIGTQDLPQLPPGGESFIYLRAARGITGQRVQTFYKEMELSPVEKKFYKKEVTKEYGYRLVFFNLRPTPVVIKVIEHLYGLWEILESDPQNYQEMRDRIIYELKIPPHTKRIIKYKARMI